MKPYHCTSVKSYRLRVISLDIVESWCGYKTVVSGVVVPPAGFEPATTGSPRMLRMSPALYRAELRRHLQEGLCS